MTNQLHPNDQPILNPPNDNLWVVIEQCWKPFVIPLYWLVAVQSPWMMIISSILGRRIPYTLQPMGISKSGRWGLSENVMGIPVKMALRRGKSDEQTSNLELFPSFFRHFQTVMCPHAFDSLRCKHCCCRGPWPSAEAVHLCGVELRLGVLKCIGNVVRCSETWC